MLRVIKELRPAWVVGENVTGFVNLGLDRALSDLEAESYETRPYVIPACAVGAPHRRDRVFIVAHALCDGSAAGFANSAGREGGQPAESFNSGTFMADTNNKGLDFAGQQPGQQTIYAENGVEFGSWRAAQPGLGGMVDGLPTGLDGYMTFPPEPDIPRIAKGVKNRVNRLKCLGNAVVPQQVYPILAEISGIERRYL